MVAATRWLWPWIALSACTGQAPPTEPRPVATERPDSPTGDTAQATPIDPDPGGPVLVIPVRQGLRLMALDGSVVWSRTWSQLVGGCGACGGEGASLDGDGMLVSFTTGRSGPLPQGGIARLDASGELDFRVDGFGFPHDAIRDPADDSIIVTETAAHQITWIDGTGASSKALQAASRESHPPFGGLPNGADRFDHEGRSYLLLSHRRDGAADLRGGGLLTLWDITEPGAVDFVWRFPEIGAVDTPHGPVFRIVDGVWWLLWAHTGGASSGAGGTVGLAATDDPRIRPTYVADLEPGSDVGSLGFLRGVELTDDGALLLTDTGQIGGGPVGRVIEARWPDLAVPAEPRGGHIGDQTFVDLGPASERLTGLDNAFEGWLWDGRFEDPPQTSDRK